MLISRYFSIPVRIPVNGLKKANKHSKPACFKGLRFFLLQGFGGHDRYTAAIPAPGGYYCNAFCRPRQRYCSTYAHVYALMDLSHGMPTPSWSVQTTSQSQLRYSPHPRRGPAHLPVWGRLPIHIRTTSIFDIRQQTVADLLHREL